MKILLISFCVLVLALGSCHRKTVSSRDVVLSNTTKPAKSNAWSNTETEPLLHQGKAIYIERCGRCHSLKPVEQYDSAKWVNILAAMMPKARVNGEEQTALKAYVNKYARK